MVLPIGTMRLFVSVVEADDVSILPIINEGYESSNDSFVSAEDFMAGSTNDAKAKGLTDEWLYASQS
jgi:hypothetical protein